MHYNEFLQEHSLVVHKGAVDRACSALYADDHY